MSRRIRAEAFWFYALTLIVLTHWPRLDIGEPIPRPDLYIHVVAFGLWTCLLAGLVRPLLVLGLIASVYAAFDESTQAIPIVHRHAGWSDFAANLFGVWLAVCLIAGIRRFTGPDNRRSDPAAPPPGDPDQPAGPSDR